VYYWDYYELQFMQPTVASDPNYWFTFLAIQKGWNPQGKCNVAGTTCTKTAGSWNFDASWVGSDIHVNGALTTIAAYVSATQVTLTDSQPTNNNVNLDVWVKAPDSEGRNESVFNLYKGRWVTDSGQYQGVVSIPGTMCYLHGTMPANWTIPPPKNPDGTVNLYTTYRYWLYTVSHAQDNPNGNSPGYVLQTVAWDANWDGSKDYTQLSPVTNPPALDLTQSAIYGLKPTGAIAGGNGMPLYVKVQGPLYSDINGLNVNMGSDFVVQNGAITQAAVDLAKAYNFDPTNFKNGNTNGQPLAVNQIAVNSLIAGTALFAGDVIFAYSPVAGNPSADGGKVLINSYGIAIADNYRNPQYTMAIGRNAQGVVGITLAAPGTNAPMTQITSNGVAVSSGSFSTTVNATGITLTSGGTSSIGISSTDVTINQGHLVITSGTNPSYKIITGPQVFDSTYNSLAVQVQGTNTDGSFDMASLVSRGLIIYNAPNSSSADTNHVIASLTRDPANDNNSQLVLYHVSGGTHVLDIILDAITSQVRANSFAVPGNAGKAGTYTLALAAGGSVTLTFSGGILIGP
jgi:hypothetical protein